MREQRALRRLTALAFVVVTLGIGGVLALEAVQLSAIVSENPQWNFNDIAFSLATPLVLVLSGVILVPVLIRANRLLRDDMARLTERAAAEAQRVEEFVDRTWSATSHSEEAARKLANQVAENLAAAARISVGAAKARNRSAALSEQVTGGASAVEEIRASIESLARQIASQTELVEQSAAAVEEMSASITSVANVARAKHEAADRLTGLTEHGGRTVTATEKLLTEVGEQVESVNEMIRVINHIAAQTNLLAMNAAIEAAHAGSYGRGFAVVADEIRSLAVSTAGNSSTISKTLKELVARIAQTRTAGAAAGNAFREIDVEVRSVSQAFGEITASTAELSIGAREVVTSIDELRRISVEIRSNSEEMQVGANEVTTILGSARDTAVATSESMGEIGEAATEVTVANSRISERTVENNAQIGGVLEMLGTVRTAIEWETTSARRRLTIASMILDQLSWVARIRAAIDGRTVDERDRDTARSGQLGEWLANQGREVIRDAATLERLRAKHREARSIGHRILEKRGSTEELEQLFGSLMLTSEALVEMLSGHHQDATLAWTQELSVGVRVFDEHHRKLIGLINELADAMRSGDSQAALHGIFDKLLEYTAYHFRAEERAFKTYDYPHAANHRAHHARLVEQATDLRRRMAAGQTQVSAETLEFLRDWVVKHIMKEDRGYSSHLAGKQIEVE